MINIVKKYPLQYKIQCDQCGKEGYINKRYFDKFGWKHQCVNKNVINNTTDKMENVVMEIDLTQDINGFKLEIIPVEPPDLMGMYLDNHGSDAEVDPIELDANSKDQTDIIEKPKRGRPKKK